MEMNQNQKNEQKKSGSVFAKGAMLNNKSSMQECIDKCMECSTTCLELIPYCLNKGAEHAEAQHIMLLQNCAEICRTSATLMISNSQFSADLCNVCASVCNQCADSCKEFGDDQMMNQCATVCRECADSCKQTTKMA